MFGCCVFLCFPNHKIDKLADKYLTESTELSDKNVIKSTTGERKGQPYDDQILLIEDLKKTANMSVRELLLKAYNYSKVEFN